MIPTVEWKNGIVRMLDQTRLPLEIVYNDCKDYETVARGIKELWVRGAPAIGVSAAMGLALGSRSIPASSFEEFWPKFEEICAFMAATRPTAVNLFWAIERIKKFVQENRDKGVEAIRDLLVQESQRMLDEDIATNRRIGSYGSVFVSDDDNLITHCNAGAIATAGYGTAEGVMRAAVEEGKKIHVYVDETRPVLQGARLTAWELMQEKIPCTLITDNMAGYFMYHDMVDLAIVGADRIALNGDVANKIGTYSLAVLCKEHGIPFYVAAPLSTIDFSMESGYLIPIEERNPDEVTHVFGKVQIAPDGVKAANPAFDVTPARYVTAIITEVGAFYPRDIHKLADGKTDPEKLRIK
ncbi:MAG: S-methyl-5-thioribose-1-phosphate isomerase [Nitrospirae bacterium GWD2_57_9]|nr:MAG: S-methyl-5-thioribose-1-phosphate isomerase [Nitrospirae bacterium GWD2_57_9]OGW45563.1 MAG: S-methyl-5-thioribose-1-phosphate isomerase [Nitrospirae bacterium GWC2_57_9]